MPSARANISAKFIAQIETSNTCETRNSAPADEARPRIVSSSGRPAATSEPKASTRIASVTGQLISSERIIASRLAVLKSDHMPDAPVRLTRHDPFVPVGERALQIVGRATIAVGSPLRLR